MELVVFFLVLIVTGAVLYSILCFLFFGLTERPVLMAFRLSPKLAIGSIVGVIILGFGAILLPTIWINAAIEPLPSYSKWRDIIIALIISTLTTVVMYFAAMWLAWEVIG